MKSTCRVRSERGNIAVRNFWCAGALLVQDPERLMNRVYLDMKSVVQAHNSIGVADKLGGDLKKKIDAQEKRHEHRSRSDRVPAPEIPLKVKPIGYIAELG